VLGKNLAQVVDRPSQPWLNEDMSESTTAPATSPTQEVTMNHSAKLAAVRASLVAEVQAGGSRPLVKFAQRTLERAAGGNVTVLPVEAASATFLAGPTTAAGQAARAELAASFLRGLGA
jgi:hypothetical protein